MSQSVAKGRKKPTWKVAACVAHLRHPFYSPMLADERFASDPCCCCYIVRCTAFVCTGTDIVVRLSRCLSWSLDSAGLWDKHSLSIKQTSPYTEAGGERGVKVVHRLTAGKFTGGGEGRGDTRRGITYCPGKTENSISAAEFSIDRRGQRVTMKCLEGEGCK